MLRVVSLGKGGRGRGGEVSFEQAELDAIGHCGNLRAADAWTQPSQEKLFRELHRLPKRLLCSLLWGGFFCQTPQGVGALRVERPEEGVLALEVQMPWLCLVGSWSAMLRLWSRRGLNYGLIHVHTIPGLLSPVRRDK